MSLTFTRRYLDAALFTPYKRFVEFEDEIVTWDTGPLANNGQALSSSDGATFAALFSVLSADVGTCTNNDNNGMAVYNGHLFISFYRTDTVNPKVIEYDPVSGSVTNHLVNPQAGGVNNYMGLDLVVWNRKLWLITDITTGVSDRRVIYYYDGSSWTAITDYDGATYLDYDHVDGGSPIVRIRYRTSRLFVFNGELYFLATRYHSATGHWAWEVWKFDADDYDNFELVYDSSILADDFVFSAVLEQDGTCYVLGNKITATGNPTNIAKLYASTDMETWTEESEFPEFEDAFDDASRDSRWTDEANNGTITEAGGLATYAVAALTNGDFWGAVKNAPISTIDTTEEEVTVVVKLNSYTVNDQTRAGIYITDTVSGNNGVHFGRTRNDGSAINGLVVVNMGVGSLASNAVTTLPIWLRVRISGSGAGSVMEFDYSTDSYTWTTLHTQNNETWGKAGLAAWNWGVFNAISAPFEFFDVFKSPGFAYGEKVFDGYRYMNFINVANNNTWIRYHNELDDEFSLEQEITTNTNNRGGGLESFSVTNELFAGKYKEIYGAPRPTYKQTRTKAKSLVAVEMDFKDRAGDTVTKRYAPIDTRAPTRFYSGKIQSISSLQRAVDDRTGLFRVSDMNITLDNSDFEFSELLETYYLKNQEMRLYHMWADEPERLRQHIITMIIDDQSLKGREFNLLFKDITQKYFSIKVPADICLASEFGDIHPDAVGKYMPEILGEATLGGTYEHPGAVEAVYVDTTGPPYRCLASAGLITIPTDEVWIGDVQKTEGGGNDYTVVQAGGRTYIHFNIGQDPGDDTVAFNAEGYAYGEWNSTNGYVQNPAYIILYFLRFIMNIPFSLINVDSFDDMADMYDRMSLSTNGKLIINNQRDAMEILRQLLFTYGAKGFVAKDGRFKLERKDISNYQTDITLFNQIDLLTHGERNYNLRKAANAAKAKYDFIPWQNLFKSAGEDSRPSFDGPQGPKIEDDIRMRREEI